MALRRGAGRRESARPHTDGRGLRARLEPLKYKAGRRGDLAGRAGFGGLVRLGRGPRTVVDKRDGVRFQRE